MKRKLRKMSLSRETLHALDATRMRKVAGGLSETIRCSGTCSDAAPCTDPSGNITGCDSCTLYPCCP